MKDLTIKSLPDLLATKISDSRSLAYPKSQVLALYCIALINGCKSWSSIEFWVKKHRDVGKRLRFPSGKMPSIQTVKRAVFSVDRAIFESSLVDWYYSVLMIFSDNTGHTFVLTDETKTPLVGYEILSKLKSILDNDAQVSTEDFYNVSVDLILNGKTTVLNGISKVQSLRFLLENDIKYPSIDDYLFFVAGSNKDFIGSSFLVKSSTDYYIVTAAHVVADAIRINRVDLTEAHSQQISLFHPKTKKWYSAELAAISPYEADDVAALLFKNNMDEFLPAPLGRLSKVNAQRFFTAGFREAGNHAVGEILGIELIRRRPQKQERYELRSGQIDAGMSGSPLIHNELGYVLGMVVSSWYSQNNKDEETAYGIPMDTIQSLLPDLHVNDIDAKDYKLLHLARSIIESYEKPLSAVEDLFSIGTAAYIEIPIWEYGVEYVDETSLQFSWLSQSEKEVQRKKGMLSESAIDYLINWINNSDEQYLALLAEFGMGKSTILRRLEYLLATRYLVSGGRLPIRTNLGYLREEGRSQASLQLRIRDFVEDTYQVTLELREIDSFIKGNKIVLLLDSFDEMSLAVTKGTQSANLHHILATVRNVQSVKMIIASRENYFFSGTDISDTFKSNDLFFPSQEFRIIYLRGFRAEEIQKYLETRLGDLASQFWEEIKKIHDLPDLARRPILLVMMAILKEQILQGKITTRTSLYDQFVRVWLKRERLNKRIKLKEEVIENVLETLAEEASLAPGRTFPQTEIDRYLVKDHNYTVSEAELFGVDFKVCCFLGRDKSDDYKFLHSSFREYFFSRRLIEHIRNHNWSVLSQTFITREVMSYFLDLIESHDKEQLVANLRAKIQSIKGQDYLLTNAMMFLEQLSTHPTMIYEYYNSLLVTKSQRESIHYLMTDEQMKLAENFVHVPTGTFFMGSWKGRPDETPIHEKQVGELLLCRYPTTNIEFMTFVNETNYITLAEQVGKSRIWTGGKWQYVDGLNWRNPRPDNIALEDRLDHPVVQIAWEDAIAYCGWKSKKTGLIFDLPTEAEWEYACRAGSRSEYCFGDDLMDLGDYGWYKDNLDASKNTQPVGKKRPNIWGLYDMHGNVREWCHEVYERYPGNNLNWDLGNRYFSISGTPYYVLRGGHFASTAQFLRSAIRVSGEPGLATDYTGFRLKICLDVRS